MNTKRFSDFDHKFNNLSLPLLILAFLPTWLACSYAMEEETINLTPWLKQRKQVKVSPLPMNNAYIQVSHTVKKTKKFWLFSYTAWEDFNYDIVSVIDDQHVLAGRSHDYAVSLFGEQLKDADFTVKLVTESDNKGTDICSGWEQVRSPGQFIDCEDKSNKNEFVVRRMNFQGKEITQIRIEANRSNDLHTVAEIMFYDDRQQIYVLDVSNASNCRLNMINSEQIIAYEEDRKGRSYTCRDAPFWRDKLTETLRAPLLFGEIGQNRTISNRYLNPKFR